MDELRVVARGHRGYIEPGAPEWLRLITPSKVPAILGISRWESPYRLWHRMKGTCPPEPPADRFDLGHDMEATAAARWRRHNAGWKVSAGEVQYHPPAGHYAFPAMGTIDRRTSRGRQRRVLEVKIARNQTDLEVWGDDLKGECPEDYAAQVIAQRMFCAAAQPSVHWLPDSHLLVMGPYYNERIYPVEYDLDVAAWIVAECERFWALLQSDTPPDLDDKVATYECLKELHPDINGETVSVAPSLAIGYAEAVAAEKAAKQEAQGWKNKLAAEMGNAQYAVVGNLTVADRRNNGKGGVSMYGRPAATPEKIRQEALPA